MTTPSSKATLCAAACSDSAPATLGEFNITIHVRDLKQLDDAFQLAASRGPDIEPLHAAVYSQVTNLTFGLSRDFPDPVRVGKR